HLWDHFFHQGLRQYNICVYTSTEISNCTVYPGRESSRSLQPIIIIPDCLKRLTAGACSKLSQADRYTVKLVKGDKTVNRVSCAVCEKTQVQSLNHRLHFILKYIYAGAFLGKQFNFIKALNLI